MIKLKKNHLLYTTVLLFLFALLSKGASANSVPDLIVQYSGVSPTIDGYLGAEWNDTTPYKVNMSGTADVETWIYLKHNGTYIYIGLLVWQYGSHTLDQFTVFFDEGDDGNYGSGTRDNALTDGQEDLKGVQDGPTLKDGFYNASSWYALTTEIDFDADWIYETDHGTTPSEIEYYEGLSWVDDHYECEFSIPFIGTEGGSEDGSDLNCTISDTVGFKLQWFTQPGANNYYYPAENQQQINTYANLYFEPLPTIESCSVAGIKQDSFDLGEPVYMNGTGYAPTTSFDFYIVTDIISWTDGLAIPSRVADTATTISSDILGHIPPTAVWGDPQTIGEYDVIVDINGNGFYDVNVDVLDDNDVMVTAGFIIPEFATGLTLTILSALAGLTVLKKWQNC
jgi:hypothetical protein